MGTEAKARSRGWMTKGESTALAKARMAELTELIISGRATDADNIELERLAAAVGAQAGPAVPLSTTLAPTQNGTPGAGLDASQLQLAVAVI